MVLALTKPLAEKRAKNHPGNKGWPTCTADNLTAIIEPVVKRMTSLDISQLYGPPYRSWHFIRTFISHQEGSMFLQLKSDVSK